MIVGSLVLVVALYAMSVWRRGGDAEPPPAHAASGAPVLPADDGTYEALGPDLAERAAGLEEQLGGASSDSARSRLRQQLVDLFVQEGRFDHAGRLLEEIARENPTADAWTLAGNFHYDWMESTGEGPGKVIAARRAIRAYLASLELEPDNLDVRTDLGAAYLNDPGNSMEAVLQTNRVLEADPTHVQANFNKGVMLVQIGRLDRAIEQFEKVRSLTDPDSEISLRAHEAEERVRAMMSDAAAG
jgi:tetratricopeptide (TPR) repeat protein